MAVDGDKITVDFSTLGDMRYYTGIVFRGYINGIAENVLSGGEYNRLMQKMNKSSRAVGFAVYLDLLDDFKKDAPDYDYDAVILYGEATAKAAFAHAEALRASGLRVLTETYIPENHSFRTLYTVTEGGELCEGNA